MIETLSALIREYGLWAVAFGCLFEGETSILLGLLAVHHGLLPVEGVMVSAMAGTLIGDNACFLFGHRYGRRALDRRPDWASRIVRVERMVQRHAVPLMIGYRFLYGLRYVTPVLLGSLGIVPRRFLFYSTIGTVIWGITLTVIGTALAGAIGRAMTHVETAERALAVIALVLASSLALIYRRRLVRILRARSSG